MAQVENDWNVDNKWQSNFNSGQPEVWIIDCFWISCAMFEISVSLKTEMNSAYLTKNYFTPMLLIIYCLFCFSLSTWIHDIKKVEVLLVYVIRNWTFARHKFCSLFNVESNILSEKSWFAKTLLKSFCLLFRSSQHDLLKYTLESFLSYEQQRPCFSIWPCNSICGCPAKSRNAVIEKDWMWNSNTYEIRLSF